MLHPEKIQQVKSFMDGFKGYPDIQVSVTPLWTPGTKDIMEYEEEVWNLVT